MCLCLVCLLVRLSLLACLFGLVVLFFWFGLGFVWSVWLLAVSVCLFVCLFVCFFLSCFVGF